MALCSKDLEDRKEQEAGNRRSIEQAANDLKVKHDLLLHWMVIFQGETFYFPCSYSKTEAAIASQDKSVFPVSITTYCYQRERRGKESPKARPSLPDQLNISERTMLTFLCRGIANSSSRIRYSGFTDACCIALNCIIEQTDFRVK